MLCGGHDSKKCIWIAELRTLSFAKVVIGKKVYLGTGRNAAGQITQRKNVIRGIIGPRDDRGADPDITVREMFRDSAQVGEDSGVFFFRVVQMLQRRPRSRIRRFRLRW